MSQLTFISTPLPISDKLHSLLGRLFTAQLLIETELATRSYVTFNFTDSTYSSDAGGFHPVEIALRHCTDGQWCIEYITDFAYMGHVYPELERHLDFDLQRGEFFMAYLGWRPIKDNNDAHELYTLWERNFLAYIESDCYDHIRVIS